MEDALVSNGNAYAILTHGGVIPWTFKVPHGYTIVFLDAPGVSTSSCTYFGILKDPYMLAKHIQTYGKVAPGTDWGSHYVRVYHEGDIINDVTLCMKSTDDTIGGVFRLPLPSRLHERPGGFVEDWHFVETSLIPPQTLLGCTRARDKSLSRILAKLPKGVYVCRFCRSPTLPLRALGGLVSKRYRLKDLRLNADAYERATGVRPEWKALVAGYLASDKQLHGLRDDMAYDMESRLESVFRAADSVADARKRFPLASAKIELHGYDKSHGKDYRLNLTKANYENASGSFWARLRELIAGRSETERANIERELKDARDRTSTIGWYLSSST